MKPGHTLTNSAGSQYSDEQRRQAALNYAVLGNMTKVSEQTGISTQTLCDWKNHSDWWNVLLEEIREEKQDQIDALYTNGIHRAAERVLEKIEGDDAKLLDLVKTTAILFDKRQLVRNQPTSIRTDNTRQLLQELAEGFRSISQGNVIEGEVIK